MFMGFSVDLQTSNSINLIPSFHYEYFFFLKPIDHCIDNLLTDYELL